MGSVGNQDPWAPYDNTKDCSHGICNIYCPQFCYFFFPPPPPSDRFSGALFSPLIIALIGFLVGVFILVAYYTLISRHFLRGNAGNEENHQHVPHDQSGMATAGLDEAIIAKIAVCKYRKGDGLGPVVSTECAVCLGEFQDNESLRILPKCVHAFHIPCIDTWLKSHSNCPMCRENVAAAADEASHHDEVVLVIDHQETRPHHNSSDNNSSPKSPIRENFENVGRHQGGVSRLRRSVSLGTSSPRRQLLISDIMRGIGSLQSEHCIKRSNSTGFIMSRVLVRDN